MVLIVLLISAKVVLTRHEIANDNVNGIPAAVTFCPLCNTAIIFNPVLDGRQLKFIYKEGIILDTETSSDTDRLNY